MPKESIETPGATRVAFFGADAVTAGLVSRCFEGCFLKIAKVGSYLLVFNPG